MMNRGSTRLLSAFAYGGILLAVFSGATYAHEGYPVILDAKYQEIKKGTNIKRMVFVNGHAHYPNGTRIAVGIRLEEQKQYLAWYNTTVKNQGFIVEMGPYNKEFASGLYIVEAWFIWERQSGSIQAAIHKAEDGLERGVDNCDPEIVKERKRCKTKSVFGAGVVQVGTPGRFIIEEEETRTFFTSVHESLTAILNEAHDAVKLHSDKAKTADTNVEAWKAKNDEWNARLSEVDQAVLKWHGSKLTIRHQVAYSSSVNAILNIQSLLGIYGGDLYNLPSQAFAGGADGAAKEVATQLSALLEDLKAPAEEGEPKKEDAGSKKEDASGS